MEIKTNLRHATTKYFDSINFSELNDQWIDQVIDNEFTDAEENNITISILFVNDAVQTLNKLQEVCLAWREKSLENESMNTSDANESAREDVMWTILDEMDVGVKHIQSIIYLLCNRAMKSPTQENFNLGLTSAKFYFNCLTVPGSGAYSVYHPNLFQLCVNCMPVPDYTSDKDGAFQRVFEKVALAYVSALFSLIPLFRDFHLGDDTSVIESTIKKLVEMTTCEVQLAINFNINYPDVGIRELIRRNKLSFNVTALAYQALSVIIDTDLNGDRDKNYNVILSFLNRSILCYKARKSATVSQKHLQVKDNAVNFIIHNLKVKEFCSEVTQVAMKRLCLGVSDKTDIRNTVSLSIIHILFNLKNEHVAEMIEWFLLLVDSADTKDRVFALDVLGHLLCYSNQESPIPVPDACKSDLFNASVIFAILTRCDDVSPGVRTKALTVLSQNMNCIFKFLDKTKEVSAFEIEDSEDFEDRDIDVNGNHRYFWYNIKSFRERLNEIASILQRRIEDNNVTARKAALVALENLMVFDITYITDENLKFFYSGARDANIVVRKQMIQSLTVIAEAHIYNSEVQEAWLKCILPLLLDPENTVQGAASLVLQKQILQTILSHNEVTKERAFTLLKVLSSGEFLSHQVYIKKAFSLWKSEEILKPQSIVPLQSYVGTVWEDCIWFFISHFSSCCPLPTKISSCCIEQFQKFHSAGEYPSFMEYILKVLLNTYKKLPSESLEIINGIICESLKSFSIPVEIIHLYIELLYKIYQHFDTASEFVKISGEVIQKCEEHLTEIKSQRSFPDPPSEILLAKYFCIIKEFCQLCSSNITPSIVSLLKAFSACVELPRSFMKILSPGLKAHAFAALGKICLQDEILAKELLPIFAKELLTSKYDIIRNNIVIILVEMCKRYTSFADKYVPLISLCFKDKLYLIRYQTIVLVVNLLQEGFIKWRGPLFFCLLSTLVDKKESIQELGRYSLSQLLQDKKKNLFSEHFIDSIFVFNHFAPPDNETVSQIVRDLERFALPGDGQREERMLLYRFLLESMDIKDRAYLIKSICEILTNLAEAVYPLNETTECMIRDCFNIFTCKEIRAYNVEQFEDIDEATESEFCKTELDMRRVVIIDPVIPVIVSLRNSITDPESDVMHDIILFLKEFLHDFKDSLRDILAIDKILLRQLELELKNEAERERMEKRLEKESKDKNKQTSNEQPEQVAPTSSTAMGGIETLIKDVNRFIEDGGGGEEDERQTSPQQIPVAPSPSGRSSRQRPQSSSRGNNTNGPSTSTESSQPVSSEVTSENSPEANDSNQLSSTPRVVLKKLPLTTNILNISPVANALVFSSDED